MRPVRPRVAIAHDYLTQRGGAERVVLAMARAFPDAVIHTTLYDPDATFPEFRELDIVSSRLNRVPPFRHFHRAALPLLAPVGGEHAHRRRPRARLLQRLGPRLPDRGAQGDLLPQPRALALPDP